MIQQEKEKNTGKQPVYQRLWFRMTAFLLAAIMVFSIWAGGAIQIRIKARSEQDAADIEVDVLAKYVEKIFSRSKEEKKSNITLDFLRSNGF